MKKIILIISIFVLSSCINKYETSTLLKTEKHEYKISYPRDWNIFTESEEQVKYYKTKDNFFGTIAIIRTNVYDEYFGARIKVFNPNYA